MDNSRGRRRRGWEGQGTGRGRGGGASPGQGQGRGSTAAGRPPALQASDQGVNANRPSQGQISATATVARNPVPQASDQRATVSQHLQGRSSTQSAGFAWGAGKSFSTPTAPGTPSSYGPGVVDELKDPPLPPVKTSVKQDSRLQIGPTTKIPRLTDLNLDPERQTRTAPSTAGPDLTPTIGPTKMENDVLEAQSKIEQTQAMEKIPLDTRDQELPELRHLRASVTFDFNSVLPLRPGFGVVRDNVEIRANYFELKVEKPDLSLHICNLTFKYMDKAGTPTVKATGLLSELIHHVLDRLPKSTTVASDFKSKIVTPNELEKEAWPEAITLPQSGPSGTPRNFLVEVSHSSDASPNGLVKWLVKQNEKLDEVPFQKSFPKFHLELDALGVILGHTLRDDVNIAAVGNKYFKLNDTSTRRNTRDSYRVLRRGFFQSVRPATGRLLLNVSLAHGIFWRPRPVLELLQNDDANAMSHSSKLMNVSALLSGAGVVYTVPGQLQTKGTILGLAYKWANNGKRGVAPTFQRDFGSPYDVKIYLDPQRKRQSPAVDRFIGQHVLVSEYYKLRYNVTLRKNLPLINIGQPGNPAFVAAEYCTLLPGRPFRGALTSADAEDMIKFARVDPQEQANSIQAVGVEMLKSPERKSLLEAFGVKCTATLITVLSRVLQQPKILYGKEKVATLDGRASWNLKGYSVRKQGKRSFRNVTFCVVRRSEHWKTVSDPGRLEAENQRLFTQLDSALTYMADGMKIGIAKKACSKVDTEVRKDHAEEDLQAFMEKRVVVEGRPRPDLIMFVIPERSNTDIYRAIKVLGDVKYGIHTVCIKHDKNKVENMSVNMMANIGLKINLKAGGTNHQLTSSLEVICKGKTMVIGYDVIHPTSPPEQDDEKKKPKSQVGLVHSLDHVLAQWPAMTWNQQGRQEVVVGDEFAENITKCVRRWQRANQYVLENIIVFRDGVSEGQFRQVVDYELPQMIKGCKEAGCKPKFTVVVSVKRHQTRFYPMAPAKANVQPANVKPANVKPGTVVSRGITIARYWDFFLTSHHAGLGTARPARYTVVYDGFLKDTYGNQAAAVLERLTHNMCHLFGRATTAVSICPPAYYADLVCTRTRTLMAAETDENVPQIHPSLADTMYYI